MKLEDHIHAPYPRTTVLAEEARGAWLSVALERGRSIPAPGSGVSAVFSGRFDLRSPESLHRPLSERAGAEGVGLNQRAPTLFARSSGGG